MRGFIAGSKLMFSTSALAFCFSYEVHKYLTTQNPQNLPFVHLLKWTEYFFPLIHIYSFTKLSVITASTSPIP